MNPNNVDFPSNSNHKNPLNPEQINIKTSAEEELISRILQKEKI
jgi:hypothetical protein